MLPVDITYNSLRHAPSYTAICFINLYLAGKPNKSTGINVLEELLKKIIPVLETDYKSLTTNSEQRNSFRAHIINAVVDTLTPAQANNDATEEGDIDLQEIDLDSKRKFNFAA